MSRFQGQHIGFVVGTGKDSKCVVYRLPHCELGKAPRIGDLLSIRDTESERQWLGRVEEERHVSIDLREDEVRNAMARGQYLSTELSEHEKEMYLGHDFAIRILGELSSGTPVSFRPIVRNLPPRGAKVLQLERKQLSSLVMLDTDGPIVGYYAVGDEVYDQDHGDVPIKFSVQRFISRRTAIFGVSGFGKSNLMKDIVAFLAIGAPSVGKLVFDLDGEYAFGTEQGQGLADISSVKENLLVFTNSLREDARYQDVIAGPASLNLEHISPYRAVSLLLPESRQERVYAGILSSLSREKWQQIIKYVATNGLASEPQEIAAILEIELSEGGNQASVTGMINALVPILRGHTPESTLLTEVYEALRAGATVVVDLSQMSLDGAFNAMRLLVEDLFEKNRDAFVSGGKVPEIIVFVEEAQNLLSDRHVREGNSIVRLAKEGRKYNLGLVYVSQQPGAIAKEILSQTNSYFVMHLLSKDDVRALTAINPHYDGVIAEFIQNESLQGHAYIYSTVPGMPLQSYTFATRAVKFEEVGSELQKIKPKGYRAYRQRQLEWVAKIAEVLSDVLTITVPDKTEDGFAVFRWGRIAGELSKRLPLEWPIRIPKSPEFVDDKWIREGFKHLGISYEGQRWIQGRPYIYIPETASSRNDVLPF